jgi:hypothetical protein
MNCNTPSILTKAFALVVNTTKANAKQDNTSVQTKQNLHCSSTLSMRTVTHPNASG